MVKINNQLPKNKFCTFKDIPVKIIDNSDQIYSHALTKIFNDFIKSGNFPDVLKYGDIAPVS